MLIPDFGGSESSLDTVLDAGPDILNHNVETVERLQKVVRSRATYERSLELLERAKAKAPSKLTKSGVMLGVGERVEEVLDTMRDLRNVGCDILTIGQYLRPSESHLPITRYYTPEEFAELKEEGAAMGFRHVESGPAGAQLLPRPRAGVAHYGNLRHSGYWRRPRRLRRRDPRGAVGSAHGHRGERGVGRAVP